MYTMTSARSLIQRQANFFRNIGTILTFAFAGTFISALVLGIILWLWTRIPLEGLDISFVEAMSVGATLSATDPVTILAIFNTYKVDPKLYTIIFGESILNDAIAIVLFETAQKYKPGADAGKLTILSLFESIGVFMLVFFGSLAIGIVVGIATSLLLKFTHVRRDPKIESCLIFLIAYASYFFANAIHMSGEISQNHSIHWLNESTDPNSQESCPFCSAAFASSIMRITTCRDGHNSQPSLCSLSCLSSLRTLSSSTLGFRSSPQLDWSTSLYSS
jgi:hypothetical protein